MKEIIPIENAQEKTKGKKKAKIEIQDWEEDLHDDVFENLFDEDDLDLCLEDDDISDSAPDLPEEVIKLIYEKASQYYEVGNYKDAMITFTYLLALRSEEVSFWIGLGACLQMSKIYPAAVTAYAFAANIDVDDPYIPLHGAECCFGAEQIEEGISALEDAEERAMRNKTKYADIFSEIAVLRQAWGQDVNNKNAKKSKKSKK